MRVETKFNLDQELYFLDENTQKVLCKKVDQINTETVKDKVTVKYWFKVENSWQIINEVRVFTSRQELIDSL